MSKLEYINYPKKKPRTGRQPTTLNLQRIKTTYFIFELQYQIRSFSDTLFISTVDLGCRFGQNNYDQILIIYIMFPP